MKVYTKSKIIDINKLIGKGIKFAPLLGFPNYIATDDGRIINLKRGRALKGTLDKYGYRYVILSKNRILYTRKVHRLVYQAFHGKISKRTDIHHLNQKRDSNELKNLIAIPKLIHISIHHKGKVTSEETKKKISEALKNFYKNKKKGQKK